MGKKASNIELTNNQREYLETQIRARTIQAISNTSEDLCPDETHKTFRRDCLKKF